MGRQLVTEKAQAVLSSLYNIEAADLSYNHIDTIPEYIPPTLLALNLSFNRLAGNVAFSSLNNLKELNLSNNNIKM